MKAKSKARRNGERGDDRGAHAHQEKHQNDEHENHAAQKISFHRVGGDADEIAAVVEGVNFYVGRQNLCVQFKSFLLDAFQDVLRLFAAAHQDYAFDGVVIFLESKFAQARRVADFHVADIFYAYRRAIGAADDDLFDIFHVAQQAQAAHVIKLPAL